MNQIPNIEEWKNKIREELLTNWDDWERLTPSQIERLVDHIHQQLQKVREEERERIEAIIKNKLV